jgi:hypothetical protein
MVMIPWMISSNTVFFLTIGMKSTELMVHLHNRGIVILLSFVEIKSTYLEVSIQISNVLMTSINLILIKENGPRLNLQGRSNLSQELFIDQLSLIT